MAPDKVVPGKTPHDVISGILTNIDSDPTRLQSRQLHDTLVAATSGHEQAIVLLAGHTRSFIQPMFQTHTDLEGKELHESSDRIVAKVLRRVVAGYDPFAGIFGVTQSGDLTTRVEGKFNNYVRLSAARSILDIRRRQGRDEIPTIQTPNFREENNTDEQSQLIKLASTAGLLTVAQLEAIALREKIASGKGQPRKMDAKLKQIIARVRRKIEGAYLTPQGFERIKEFNPDAYLQDAARSGKIRGIKIFGLWYTKQEWYDDFVTNHIHPPEPGYVLLSRLIPETTRAYKTIVNNLGLSELGIIKRDSRLYVEPLCVRLFLAKRGIAIDADKDGNVFP